MSDTHSNGEDQKLNIEQTVRLAVDYQAKGDFANADAVYRQYLKQDPHQPLIMNQLGLINSHWGKYEAAVDWFNQAVALKPDYAEAHNSLGITLKRLNRLADAAESYRRAIAAAPEYPEAHFNLAATLQAQNRLDEASSSYHQAIHFKPDYVEALNNLGGVLAQLGNLTQAVASYQKAIILKPAYAAAHNNLGSALDRLNKRDQAIACFRQAIALNPNDAQAHNNLGVALKKLKKFEDAITCFKQAITLHSNFAEAHYNLAASYQELMQLRDAITHFQKAVHLNPDHMTAHDNLIFALAYDMETSGEDILQESKKWEAQFGHPTPRTSHANDPQPQRQLRIGLVSGDLRHHSVSFFLESILPELNTDRLTLLAYATADTEDDLTQRLKTMVAGWCNVTAMSDEDFADRIERDRIDILVDLSGHTSHHRLALFSRKPAPVQVSWLGYNATTGLSTIDYYLGDSYVLPATDKKHFSETPWALPDIWLCFSPPDADIQSGPLPAKNNGYITFGSFNNLAKISEQTITCWAGIMHAVPDSRLYLKAFHLQHDTVRQSTRDRFAAQGIDTERLRLEAFSADRLSHLSQYQEIDMALDPFPYSGVTTSVEALWMGTPVLSLNGNRFVSRLGGSINHCLDLDAWVADSPEDYSQKAVAFASDLSTLSDLNKTLRPRLLNSPVCDAPRFAANLEKAFRGMWKNWCALQ